jgi:cytochrome c biogenesis protein CcmG, thiol:disulfide interchange protein DsbE
MTLRAKAVGQVLAVALVAGLLGLLIWKIATDSGSDANVGGEAPAFSLPRLDDTDRELALAEYQGKAKVINFWASWCGPCRDEAPLLQRAWEQNRGRDVVVVGVNMRDFLGDARGFVREFGITYPNVYDGPAKLYESYGLSGFPETVVVDRNGGIVEHVKGPIDDAEQLDAMIERALG